MRCVAVCQADEKGLYQCVAPRAVVKFIWLSKPKSNAQMHIKVI